MQQRERSHQKQLMSLDEADPDASEDRAVADNTYAVKKLGQIKFAANDDEFDQVEPEYCLSVLIRIM
jgi:hypothetical protein